MEHLKTTSNALYSCYGVWPSGIRRETYNITGPEANTKMLAYKKAGAIKVGYSHMPVPKRTVWGAA